MAGLFDVLRIGSGALSAQQLGLQVVGNNIANASTKGYHRQEVVLSSLAYPGGVSATAVRSVRNDILERRLDAAASRSGAADTMVAGTANLEALLGETSDSGLGTALSRFFSSWQKLGAAPADMTARGEVVNSARYLADGIRSSAQGLVQARGEANEQVSATVDQANALIDNIASLNRSILAAESAGTPSNDLRDQRGEAQRQLAGLIGGTANENDQGLLTVISSSGVVVVQAGETRHLQVTTNAATGMLDVGLEGRPAGTLAGTFGGSLGATISLRDTTIPALQTQLDNVATSLVNSVNGLHAAGYGLDGVTGRNLFVPAVGGPGSALAIGVDPTVAADPRRVAASQSATTVPGDNRVAVAIAAIAGQNVASGGTATLAQAVAGLQGSVGFASQSAQNEQAAADAGMQQLSDMRESESGVSVEEQMTLLSQYQRAYEAASKVIQAADQMLQTLLQTVAT